MQLKISRFVVTLLIVSVLMLGGCSTNQITTDSSSASTTTEANTQALTEKTFVSEKTSETGMQDLPRLEGKATVVMTVKGSPITIEVDGVDAPITAGNFVDLVNRGVYDGLVFHRVIRQPEPFVVQGGDPQTKDPKFSGAAGTGSFTDPKTGRARYIPLEIKSKGSQNPIYDKTFKEAGITEPPVLQHKLGAVAMARSQMPSSASSQFYFALADLKFLDGDYAVFGNVTNGMDVVNKIQQGDRIDSAKVTKGLEYLKNGGK
ncbi:MAG: peptidylprolyl isomerase [Rhizonema sp. PD37]|nr:peptidylprolyl isomerase [Rhizonema sp. PD37]